MLVVLVLAALVSAVVQRAVGAGFSLVLLPAALLALPDDQAVPCVLTAGVVLGGGLLLAGRAAPEFDRPAATLLACAVPAQVAAVLLLGGLEGTALRLVAAAALLGGCATALASAARALRTPESVAAGVTIGAIGTLTGVIGPFAALALAFGRGTGGDALRRRLWGTIALLSATGLAASAATGAGDLTGALVGLALAPALAAGARLGVPVADRLAPGRHRTVVLGVAAAGTVALLAGV